jgi:hypothetical protein
MPASFGKKETAIIHDLKVALHQAGWPLVEKTHGNEIIKGWPDLMAFRPDVPPWGRIAWIEAKRPKKGRLTKDQKIKFAEWEAVGLGVWILTGPEQLHLLDEPPNWRSFLPKARKP